MENPRIIQRMDKFGRIRCPNKMRRQLGVHGGDSMELFIAEADGRACLVAVPSTTGRLTGEKPGKETYERLYDDAGKESLTKCMAALIWSNGIQFTSYSKYRGTVDVRVETEVFTDKDFFTVIDDGDWNSNPARAVAQNLAELILDGEVEFAPIPE